MKRTRSGALRWLVVTALIGLASCDSDPVVPKIRDATFAPSLGVNLNEMTETPQGVYLRNLVIGTGAAAGTGSHVSLYYTGWLIDGTEFDAAWPPDEEPFEFRIGYGGAITGFAIGARGMQVGGKRLIVIPPELGYGNRAAGSIPPNSILVFEIELVDVK